jgi:hypothetical protein
VGSSGGGCQRDNVVVKSFRKSVDRSFEGHCFGCGFVVGPTQHHVFQGQFAQFHEDCIEGVREEMFDLFDLLIDRMQGIVFPDCLGCGVRSWRGFGGISHGGVSQNA